MQNTLDNLTAQIHYLSCLVAGYLGLYTILSISKSFANALTTNWVYMLNSILAGSFLEFVLRILAVVFFIIPIVVHTVVSKKNTKLNWKKVSLIVDLIDIIILCLLPAKTHPLIAAYPNLFAMALQWCAFPGAYGYNVASIFMTNNTRQFFASLAEVYMNHDNSFITKEKVYGFSLLYFLIGVVLCSICFKLLKRYASLTLIPLLIYIYTSVKKEEIEKQLNK